MAFDKTIQGERYWECAICGMTYRQSDTVIKNGIRVCKDCADDGGGKNA